jgi:hypothetical protein
MPAFKRLAWSLPVLMALLMGAAPPVQEERPTHVLELPKLLKWSEPPPREQDPMMENHLFAVPIEPGRLMAGSDPNFLIYPPDVSVECEHRGPCLSHGDNWTQIVQVDLFAARPEELLFGLGIGSDAGFTQSRPERGVLPKGEFWDVIAPGNAISGWPCQATLKPGHIHFAYTGTVGTGCKLFAAGVQAPDPKATSPADELRAWRSLTLILLYRDFDDYLEIQRLVGVLMDREKDRHGIPMPYMGFMR